MKKGTMSFCLFLLLFVQIVDAQSPLLYGLTSAGGKYNHGTIIEVSGNGSVFDTLYSFDLYGGYNPTGSLLKTSYDTLYGLTEYGGTTDQGVIFGFSLVNNTYNVLYSFNGSQGANPQGNLIKASNGYFYGTTSYGGANNFGVLFSFDPATKSYADLHDFDNTDGLNPSGSLLQVGNSLYGITSGGGMYTYGVIFSYNLSNNTFTKLYDLNGNQGSIAYGSFIASDGLLYGLTSAGGTYDHGTIFSFNPSGNSYNDLYNFDTTGTGSSPRGSLILVDGIFYGMTELAVNSSNIGYGTLFSFSPDGNKFSDLSVFNGVTGDEPYGSLVEGSDGNLYGMTAYGGNDTLGNIFSYNPSGNIFTNLISFNDTLGSEPYGNLIDSVTLTGIEQLQAINYQLSIYPNPSGGTIAITSSKNIDKLTVTNLLGQLIYTSEPKQVSCNLEIKDEGMYFVTVTSDNETTTKKILIVK